MIETIDLTKKYITKTRKSLFKVDKVQNTAVQNINIQIQEGKIVGILGINGAGKTTLIKMLSTLLKPTSGIILMDGMNIEENILSVKQKINLITGGERNLYWRLTAYENLKYFGSLYCINKLDEKIDECLGIVNLSDQKDQLVEQFSKGMKQRLQIARGLLNEPSYLFLDEPTLGLDVLIAHELRMYIKALAHQNNKGIVLTTHYISEAEELCDYIYLIDSGKIIKEGTPEEIKNCFDNKYHFSFRYENDSYSSVVEILDNMHFTYRVQEPVIFVESKNNEITLFLAECIKSNINISELKQTEISLEESLIEILGNKCE